MLMLANEMWWTNAQAGLFGGVAGAMCGVLGSAIGVMVPMFANKGKASNIVYGMFAGLITMGICLLVLGITALLVDQPYHVWYPILLLGFLLTVITSSLLPVVVLRYRHADQLKMEAGLLRGGVSKHTSTKSNQTSLLGIFCCAVIIILVTTGATYGVIVAFNSSL